MPEEPDGSIVDSAIVHVAGEVQAVGFFRRTTRLEGGSLLYCVELAGDETVWVCPCVVTDMATLGDVRGPAFLSPFAGSA